MKWLSDMVDGDIAVIVKIHSSGEYSKRLTEMGFVKGRRVKVIKNAPLNDPIEYELMGYSISLRRREAQEVEVVLESDLLANPEAYRTLCDDIGFSLQSSSDFGQRSLEVRGNRSINVALIGNPNCGKTTFFNRISNLNEHVGNYSGVTVDAKVATINHRGYSINLTDLPGTYSLTTYSPEERIVRQELMAAKYDFVINVVDATLLERNLYLTTQLMDMAQHIVVSLNMYDELELLGDKFDHQQMSKMLDIPFVPTVARRGEGVDEIFDIIVEKYDSELPHSHVESNFGLFIEDRLRRIVEHLGSTSDVFVGLPRRYVAIDLLGGDSDIMQSVDDSTLELVAQIRSEIELEYGDKIQQVLADSRYGYIAGALKETLTVGKQRFAQSQMIDNFATHKVWGFPIFLAIVWLMFYATFTLGVYPQEWIEKGVELLGEFVDSVMADGALKDMVVDGVIGGVGGVIVFLPNILLLFLFISILEDSGYMARAAFIMDRLMHRIGLHGKSFVPMIMGFGCNVPAIIATRIIEDRNNRLLTILIIPFISCSARLPVYILIAGAFFVGYESLVLFGLYLFGIVVAVITSLVLKRVLFSSVDHPFVMELPPYRLPLVHNTIKHMWNKASQYLRKMGGIILLGSVLIWAMGYYPTKEDSYLERVGHTIEPAIEPLGFDWKVGVSLISGVVAKEIVVSTMSVLHSSLNDYNAESEVDADIEAEAEDDDNSRLIGYLRNDRYDSGAKAGELVFSLPVAISFLLFVLIYFPCFAVISAVRSETGSWLWALFTVVYTTALAWIVSFVAYNVASFFVGG
ncbi:MAG: ferrous iron transport protein B [Rikenellaceae bacterium]